MAYRTFKSIIYQTTYNFKNFLKDSFEKKILFEERTFLQFVLMFYGYHKRNDFYSWAQLFSSNK